jgi:pimeloyl-ACP methyl ester carboxylesterase
VIELTGREEWKLENRKAGIVAVDHVTSSTGQGIDRLNRQLTLRDGRRLGWAEYGAAEGRPVLYFHGWPASRLEPRVLDGFCAEIGVRLIALDRPGMGLSDFKPQRRLLDWPRDVLEVAEYLDFGKFAVLGVSGGGPYAAACAAAMPDRLVATLMVCSMAPLESAEGMRGMAGPSSRLLRFARAAPWAARILAGPCLRAIWGRGEHVMPRALEVRLPEVDKQMLARPGLRESLVSSSREAFRFGARGPAWDGFLYSQPWGFRLEEIRTPVILWHGEADVIIPPAMGRLLAKQIPNCHATFYPDDGHLSLPFKRFRAILMGLKG